MGQLRDTYGNRAGRGFEAHDYDVKPVLQYFRQKGLRKAAYPAPTDLGHQVDQFQIARAITELTERGFLTPHPMGRQCGPFQMAGYIMTYAGELHLEAMNALNSDQIEMNAMLSLLQQGRAANAPFAPHIAYMTKERTAHLVQNLVQDKSMERLADGTIKLSEHGKAMIPAYEAHLIQSRGLY